MKRFILLLTVVIMVMGTWGSEALAADNWTFMVYLDGDNNLEGAGIDDFLEISSVGSDANVHIVVQFDRIDGYDTTYGDWQTCKRFYVTSGMTPIAANAVSDIGEANMGDPATLTGFIDWATTNYPASNYALILWDHGGGWRDEERAALLKALGMARGGEELEDLRKELEEKRKPIFKAVCWDDTNGGDCLYMKEVKSALNSATTDMDLVGFDACLMGMIEVAHEIKDTGASVMVGSEETEPWDGWPYDTILGDLNSNPLWTTAQLGTAIVDRYYQSYGNSETQSAIDLGHMDVLSGTVSDFADAMRNHWDTNQGAVKTAAQDVMDELDTAIIHDQHGTGWPGAHGLAIYYPATQGEFDSDYNGTIIDFPADTSWEEFLSDFYASMGGSWINDAKSETQEFYYDEHIDLYDFCDNIVNYIAPCPTVSGGDFEGGVIPPTDWTHVQNNVTETWQIDSYSPYEGTYAAKCLYDPNLVDQDEWLVTPYITDPTEVSFYSFGSCYWCRDTYDNCDLEVWLIVGSGVNDGDDVYLGKADDDWPNSFVYAKSTFSVSAPVGTPVRIGFRYVGNDGAQIDFDLVKVCTGGGTETVTKDELAVDFKTLGIYVYDTGIWNRIYQGVDPEGLCSFGTYLAVDFGTAYGLYVYDAGAWTRVYKGVAIEKMAGFGGKLAVDFGTTYPIYEYDFGTDTWSPIYTYSSPRDTIEALGDKLVVDFKTAGIYVYDAGIWNRIYKGVDPVNIVSFGDKLAIDFGTVYGLYVYEYDTDTWTRVYKGVAIEKMAEIDGDLAVDFGTAHGLYVYEFDTDNWTKVYKGVAIEKMAGFDGNLAVDFGTTYPIYEYDFDTDNWNSIYQYSSPRDELVPANIFD